MSDQEIIDKLIADEESGVREGVELLLDTYGQRVRFALAAGFKVNSQQDFVLDSVHDAAFILQKKARELRPEWNLYGFFRATAVNAYRFYLRNRKPEQELSELEWENIAAPQSVDPPCNANLRARVRAAVTLLSPQERLVLDLLLRSDFWLSAAEIADILHTSLNTVQVAISRIKKKLRRPLSGNSEGEVSVLRKSQASTLPRQSIDRSLEGEQNHGRE